MSEPVFTRAAVREVDRRAIEDYAIPSIVLMENAGANAARVAWDRFHPSCVLILAGTGNNGGDGFVVARHLHNRGCRVRILVAGDPERMTRDARTNLTICERMRLSIGVIDEGQDLASALPADCDLLVDALFGTGLDRAVRGWRGELIAQVNERRASGAFRTLSLDLPSGLDADSGQPLGACIRADCTCTFVGPKAGFFCAEASRWLGEVVVCDIGAPRELCEELGIRRALDAGKRARDDG